MANWETHHDVLYNLYIVKDKPLKDVKALMESDHVFFAE